MAQKLLALKLCLMCTFDAAHMQNVMTHLRAVHSSDPNFVVTCGLNGCSTTSRSFSVLYSHVYRHHPDILHKRKEPLFTLGVQTTSVVELYESGSSDPFTGTHSSVDGHCC